MSVQRNAPAIVEAWPRCLPVSGRVLEVGSGTGEHGVRLVRAYPGLSWQASDPDPDSRRSAAAWAETLPGGAPAPPRDLDAAAPGWWRGAGGPYDVIFCANMIHIAPFAATEGLLEGAAALLLDGGSPHAALALYGPFSRRGAIAPSNARFDASLRARDPAFGVRDLDDHLQPLAARYGLALSRVVPMPANNHLVLFAPN